jgi:transposase
MARKVYNAEFKRSAISLVTEQNYTPEQAAKSLGIHVATLRQWVRKYRVSGKIIDPVEEADLRKRNNELEREVSRLRLERDILKKAAAFFAKETTP